MALAHPIGCHLRRKVPELSIGLAARLAAAFALGMAAPAAAELSRPEQELKTYPNISFKYFETKVLDDQLEFSYQLKEGISNDRIGYVILRREKVVEMLEKL